MAEVEKLRRGNIYEEDNQLWRVLEHNHIKMGRGNAVIRLRVRNVRTGSTVEKTYNNGTRVKDVRLESREVQYLYTDGDFYYFMDTETYDQFPLTPDVVEGVVDFMVDNTVVTLESYENEPLSVSLPTTVDLKVTWAEAAVAGDTANAPTKQVELETGYKLQVPMFVNEGDTIRVDTRSGEYVTRVLK
jgi:elongation factor P